MLINIKEQPKGVGLHSSHCAEKLLRMKTPVVFYAIFKTLAPRIFLSLSSSRASLADSRGYS